MKCGNLENVDPLLTKLRIAEGGKHLAPRSAASRFANYGADDDDDDGEEDEDEDDLLSRSIRRREFLRESCDEMRRHRRDRREAPPEGKMEKEAPARECRGSSFRTRKLWDFDSVDADNGNDAAADNGNDADADNASDLLSPRRRTSAEQRDQSPWTARDVRREARRTVAGQVRRDILEMEQGARTRIRRYDYDPSAGEDGTAEEATERDQGARPSQNDGMGFRLAVSNEDSKERGNHDHAYGDLLSPSKWAGRKPYVGINQEYQSQLSYTKNTNSEDYVSTADTHASAYTLRMAGGTSPRVDSERAARLQRIRDFNSRNHPERSAPSEETETFVATSTSTRFTAANNYAHTKDEIMPPSPLYYSIIRERNERDNNAATLPKAKQSSSISEFVNPQSSYTRPPFSPPTKSNRSRIGEQPASSLSPPRRRLASSRGHQPHGGTPPSHSKHNNGRNSGSPSPTSIYVSTHDLDAVSVKSALSADTPSRSSSKSQSVAATTLSVILERIQDAKENFTRALSEGNVDKQGELAGLIARLGEAAVAMKRLEDL